MTFAPSSLHSILDLSGTMVLHRTINAFATHLAVGIFAIMLGCTANAQESPASSSESGSQEDGIPSSSHENNASEGERLYALKLKSLFEEKCNACHGDDPDDLGGGLDLTSLDSIRVGGDTFGKEVVVVGDGEASKLYQLTLRNEEGYEMPPKEAEKLTQEEAWWIRDWIDAGAPWPSAKRIEEIQEAYAEGEVVVTSGGLNDAWTSRRYEKKHLWAYRPLVESEIPADHHPIDYFVDQALEQRGLQPAPPAQPHILARRLSYDLHGLPPAWADVAEFTHRYSDSIEDAVTWYAGKLLSMPQYGEQLASHWLDVARYADSAGFANDYARPNAWRYRDYVIHAFNDDKPYDQFVREQIAGDEIDDTKPQHLVATGFLRMGPWEQTSMSVFRVTRQQWLDDVTDSVGQTFLAHALQCAKCHDHKFDPVPTRDYYSMMAIFTTTQFAERDAAFMPGENLTGIGEVERWIKEKIASYEKQRKELNDKIKSNKQTEDGDAKVGDNGLDPGDENSLARMSKNIARHQWELDKALPIAFSVHTGKTIERKNVGARVKMPANPWGKGEIEQDTILNGGDAFSRGDKVSPAPLSAAVALAKMSQRPFPTGRGKRRLALADWIVRNDNPLTARVIVNRVWSWHFGRGIAGNPNNFGATGQIPTHPELLDFLAGWFMENGWSIKKLNSLILSSKAYQRSSQHPQPEQFVKIDPKGEWYAAFAPRRLTAEEIRDSMLFASREINLRVGGFPCRPDMNQEVAMQPRQIMGGTASVYEPDATPAERNRRSIYVEKTRGLRDPFFETFNQPGPDKSCELRETSTVAPQALTMLNAAEHQDRALAFANDLLQDELDDRAIINRAFRACVAREPTPAELDACLRRWEEARLEEESKAYPSPQFPTSIVRTVMAEKTGEPYDFIEEMPIYHRYVADLQPHEVDARTRGLAHVCLVLFNMNEFVYVD